MRSGSGAPPTAPASQRQQKGANHVAWASIRSVTSGRIRVSMPLLQTAPTTPNGILVVNLARACILFLVAAAVAMPACAMGQTADDSGSAAPSFGGSGGRHAHRGQQQQ